MNKKTILSIVAVAILLLAGAFIYFSLAKGNAKNFIDAKYHEYISAYTSGVVSRKSDVRVRFTSQVVEEELCGKDKPVHDKLLSISPSIEGTLYWYDPFTLVFEPTSLDQGTEYECIVELANVMEVEDGYETFVFKFSTLMQNFNVNVKEIEAIDKTKLQYQKLKGEIVFADFEDEENVQDILSAEYLNDEMKVSISKTMDDNIYHFEIDSIKRQDEASVLTLKWDGSSVNVDKNGKEEVTIAALGDFKFLEAKIIYQPSLYVKIQFSDPLKEDQNLGGLLFIDNSAVTNYSIDNNIIKIYPNSSLSGNHNVKVNKGVKNVLGYKLKEDVALDLLFEKIKPAVRLVNKGTVLPASENGLLFPFEAVNLKAVDVRIAKIYNNNITQFLQVNEFDGLYQLGRVAKTILKKTVSLQNTNTADMGRWNKFYLDLNDLIEIEEGAMYNISIGFRKKHSLYNCDENSNGEDNMEEIGDDDIDKSWKTLSDNSSPSYWDYYNGYSYSEYWDYHEDPCHGAYYGSNRSISQNLFATNLGTIAKKGENGKINVYVTNMLDAMPVAGAEVKLLNYQKQVIKTATTDEQGMAEMVDKEGEAYFVLVQTNTERSYLKLTSGSSLSLSMFDVSGAKIEKGLKGFMFGERGVWRPGDSLYISFILEDGDGTLPKGHPIRFELINPKGQKTYEKIVGKNDLDFYVFRMNTSDDAPTGNWAANVEVGGVTFNTIIKIETVKPNRLKINLDFGKEYLTKDDGISTTLSSKWLHGALAKNLKAHVDVSLHSVSTNFEKYPDFTFNNPTVSPSSYTENVFDGSLNEKGEVAINYSIKSRSAKGKNIATFTTKVFEESGEFSIDKYSIPYFPNKAYIGLKLPKGDAARGMLLTDTTHQAKAVLVDAEGNLFKEDTELEFAIYKVEWRWWWDNSEDGSASYSSTSYRNEISRGTVMCKNGRCEWDFMVKYPDWGRYFVEVKSKETNHTTGKYVYIDWPGWAGRAQREGAGSGAAMLPFTTDKSKYNIGEEVKVSIPVSKQGRALVTIESGSEVVESFWVQSQNGETQFKFTASEKMVPNVFVSVSLLQPHSSTENDLPIRMYGIKPITVSNPYTELKPVLTMPDEIRADETVRVKVSEQNGRAMTYVLAMVDEGLLDLTRFKTPDPWNTFYAREALGVTSWDYYDDVIGAYGKEIERLLSIGGDAEFEKKKDGKSSKAQRFKPMVRFYGPFSSDGDEMKHDIEMPKYIGSVRTMVIARDEKSYGSAEKTTPVKKPLMVLATLPRVLTPGDTLKMPVTIFRMDDNLKTADISVSSNDYVKVLEKGQVVDFGTENEAMAYFTVVVPNKEGIAQIKINATSRKEKADYDIEIEVRSPNPELVETEFITLQGNESKMVKVELFGLDGTNTISMELNTLPPINLDQRLRYLIRYPHGCIEQTTSSVFPQLYLSRIVDIPDAMKKKIEENVKAGIKRLRLFQLSSGGFAYWPGNTQENEWGSNYAGHFLLEAKNVGYNVPSDMIDSWLKYQKRKSREWSDDNGNSELQAQSYRLYTLALAGRPDFSSMNRLKEYEEGYAYSRWRLAQAYAVSGKKDIAKSIIGDNIKPVEKQKNEYWYSYGSYVRDEAVVLETMVLLDEQGKALNLMKELALKLNSKRWYSTQTTAYSLMALAKYVGGQGTDKGANVRYTFNGSANDIQTNKPISIVTISDGNKGGKLEIVNKKNTPVFVNVVRKGVPASKPVDAKESNIKMSVSYLSQSGVSIQPDEIEQGTDFIAKVTVSNPGTNGHYQNIALSQLFPSGWEIINDRMFGGNSRFSSSSSDYRDIRDDRVYTYFRLNANSSKTFYVNLNASYEGTYYLPVTTVEEMYDNTIFANSSSKRIKVVRK